MLLYQAGDVEKNPGPDNNSNHDTSSQSSFPVFQGNFSVVHYNVQSLLQKIDIITHLLLLNPNYQISILYL